MRLFRSWLGEAAGEGRPREIWFGREGGDAGALVRVERSDARDWLIGWQWEDPGEEWYQLEVLGECSKVATAIH